MRIKQKNSRVVSPLQLQKCKASQSLNAFSQSAAELKIVEIPAIASKSKDNHIYLLNILELAITLKSRVVDLYKSDRR